MININFEKFSAFYHSKILPQLIDLEKERKKVHLLFFIPKFIAISFIISFIILHIVFWTYIENANIRIFSYYLDDIVAKILVYLSIFILVVVVITAICIIIIGERKEKYIRKLKSKVYTKIFNLVDFEYNQSVSPEFADYQKSVLKYFPKGKTFKNRYIIMRFEDEISGIFKDISFELCDAILLGHDNENNFSDKIYFQGLMFAVKLNKHFDKETIIKTDNFKQSNIKKNIIKLEDEEFNKRFKVLADDEVEARYIITPSFMERLKKFHKNKKDKTIIFFDNKCSESKNMFILTNTGKDNFEIPLNKTLLNEKIYYNLLKELVDMLEIAVALKLEQNIGL